MAACAVVWMLVMSAAATELYYEIPDNDSEYQIVNENKLDPVAAYDQLEPAEKDLKKNRLLVTLLQYVQNLKDIENKGPSNKDEDEGVIWSDLFGLKEAGVKKWVTALSNKASSKLIPRWKIKKGFDPILFEPQFLNTFIYHCPSGISWKDPLHYNQILNTRIFRRYNYGFDQNIEVYNSSSPPVYSLQKVTMPVALITSKNDPFSTPANVALLRQQLPNVVDYVVNSFLLLSHGDYVWGRDALIYYFPYIRPSLSRYNPL